MSGNTVLIVVPSPFQLPIAVIRQDYSEIIQNPPLESVISLDPIDITEDQFKLIFYQNDSFYINPQAGLNSTLIPLISFSSLNRKVNNTPFYLLNAIIDHIESQLNIHKNMFSTISLIALNKDINSLQTLCDLNMSNITTSLKWSEIVTAIRNEFHDPTLVKADVILTVCVVFVTPTQGVKPLTVNFNYHTQVTIA